jgi:ribosomal protein L16/L10AE
VVFGDFGLQSLDAGWIKAQTIEAGRIAAQQYVRGEAVCISASSRIGRLHLGRWKTDG